jgi:hypothetical protein
MHRADNRAAEVIVFKWLASLTIIGLLYGVYLEYKPLLRLKSA